MPGRIIDRDDNLAIPTGRIDASDIPQVGRKRHLQALLFALARPRFAARWLLQPAGRQLPRHHVERCHTIDLGFVIPGADGGTMALHAQGGP